MMARTYEYGRQGLARRMFIPAFVLLVTAAVSLALYKNFWQFNLPYVLQKAAAFIFGPAAFLAIGCGAIVVYPVCRSRGASVAEAFAASMITPLAWILKEVVRVSEFFSWGESLYYGLSSSLLLAIAANIGFMGLGEMIHRSRLKKRGMARAVVTPVPIAAVVFALAALYVILIWGVGVHWFYIYQEGYKAIFH
ncbi:MAG: hypothetical protein GXY28_05445 [Bacteriovoracaceae bacterium]|jgi:hypothetical protein|nr:hypothetical protein [Bacteriovoracaceae bacterium]HPW70040.1 hypothetical protein [Deltaproteobacteria bacterium]HRT46490.1 hypothetical protein [Desulfomonilia bacterium]